MYDVKLKKKIAIEKYEIKNILNQKYQYFSAYSDESTNKLVIFNKRLLQ